MKSRFLRTEKPPAESGRTLERLLIVLLVIGSGGVTKAGLIGYWKLDGTARDCSGYDNDGTETGTPSYVEGVRGLAISLSGDGEGVLLPNELHFDLIAGFTVAAWIRINQFAGRDQAIVTKGRQAWRIGRDEEHDYVGLYCNDVLPSERLIATVRIDDGQWHHVAGAYDGSHMYLYIDGRLNGSMAVFDRLDDHDDTVGIGGHPKMGAESYFGGLIDEVTIFDHALGPDEVRRLYADGGEPFLEPALAQLVAAARQALPIIKEQPGKAIDLLERKIAESQQWAKQYPAKARMLDGGQAEAFLVLAKAREAAGFPIEDVAADYKSVITSGRSSLSSCFLALLKLYEELASEDYAEFVWQLIDSNSFCLRGLPEMAGAMVAGQRSQAAIDFLQATLSAYAGWRERHPYEDVEVEDRLPAIYLQLAKAKEAAGLPEDAVADAYAKTFIGSDRSDRGYLAERATALIWLLEHERAQEYTEVIKSLVHSSDVNDPQADIVRKVCTDLESTKNWGVYQRFLDASFATTRHPGDWAVLVGSCLSDKENRWAKRYFKHVSSNPGLAFRGESILAEEYMAEKNFKKAAAIYRDILKRCGPDDDRARFEFQLCKCLLNAGQYGEARSNLESFISNNRATYRDLSKQAMLMKSRTHVQLGELDKALDSYFTLMVEYPDVENVPEIDFFIGYCYMLQGKLKAAAEAFDCLTTGYPESAYARKARVCLSRIKNMIE